MFEKTEIEIEKPKRGKAAKKPVIKVILKKSAWLDGEQLGNAGGEIEVIAEVKEQLEKSGII